MKHKEVSDIENRSYKIQPLEVHEEETEKLLEDVKRSPSLFRNYNGRRRLFYIVGVLFLVVTFVLTGKKERKKERKNETGGSFFSFFVCGSHWGCSYVEIVRRKLYYECEYDNPNAAKKQATRFVFCCGGGGFLGGLLPISFHSVSIVDR